ncbi:hypothetical protein D3C81_1487580 [compost metagenome]
MPGSAGPQVFTHFDLIAGKLDALGLAVAMEGIHRVVVFAEQAADPGAVQIDRTAALLFFQRLLQQG